MDNRLNSFSSMNMYSCLSGYIVIIWEIGWIIMKSLDRGEGIIMKFIHFMCGWREWI